MKQITHKAKLDLNVKIGGCEAKNDIHFCEWLKVKGIVAPMVESPYALRKFLQSISNNNKQKLYVNLESIQAFQNINSILKQPNIKRLTGVVIGRSDLAGSLNLEKKVNSRRIYKLVYSILKKIKKKKINSKNGWFFNSIFERLYYSAL